MSADANVNDPAITTGGPSSMATLGLLFPELLAIVAFIVSAFLLTSIYYNHGIQGQIDADTLKETALQEEAATLGEELDNSQVVSRAQQQEEGIPHPSLPERDAQAIGDHIHVQWEDRSNSSRYARYAIQYIQLVGISGHGASEGTHSMPCGTLIASDSQNKTSRIPVDVSQHLNPGIYAWRVAVVSPGFDASASPRVTSSSGDCDHDRQDDINNSDDRLSEWSPYGVFTIYSSSQDRIASTHLVRVGVNLEQNSAFSKLGNNGEVSGTDITLIRVLVEECMTVDEDASLAGQMPRINFDNEACSTKLKVPLPKCLPGKGHLCVKLVPIDRWGDWEPALRRNEIDLFAGGLTAAKGRQKTNIDFSPGYLAYKSRLYVTAQSLRQSLTAQQWLSQHRIIGVIDNSSNSVLLDYLQASMCPKKSDDARHDACHIERKGYRSYPALEQAMNVGEVEGVVIDETFVQEEGWTPLEGLSRMPGFDKYLDEFIGSAFDRREQVAFAVSHDESDGSFSKALSDGLAQNSKSVVVKRLLPELKDCFLGPEAHGKVDPEVGNPCFN